MANKRIHGIDLARALAVFGMVIVNFKLVLGKSGPTWAINSLAILEGKAAALFVILAGTGLGLLTKSAFETPDPLKMRKAKKGIIIRALLLFVLGLAYMPLWPADILHFYGIYMLCTLPLLCLNPKRILPFSLFLILGYVFVLFLFDYEKGWDFEAMAYPGFWTWDGFIRNLFYNGFHPVLPWTAFMWIGLWLGRQDLHDQNGLRKILVRSLAIFTMGWLISKGLLYLLTTASENAEFAELFSTAPMPPLPLYMISASALGVAMVCGCILLAKSFETNPMVKVLVKTGKLALTFYVAHVVLGMGLAYTFFENELSSLSFSMPYALAFCLLSMVFAHLWLKRFTLGPLEWGLRKLAEALG
ncbi:DUF418 domain-containing protein [Sediminicola luteus]|uniref:DUF418 domain-containing protein n=1 Tax=Sediminicola luteus TaxID=319238 RepID=A0A2A4GCP5_9FLAO|nr:DUF418 domain-containing protein [Sediminicola luteus]PCE66191.1 hypothetical protein B7P33_02520 [Sediminicola luteus]